MPRKDTVARRLLQILAVYGLLAVAVVGVIAFAAEKDPDKRAIVGMGIGLIVIWCILGGVAMRLIRGRFVGWIGHLGGGWRLRFVLLCIAMAMLEEAVTTSLTNAAPLLGAATEAARITSSTNYIEVISGSVVAFIPWFICWAWLLNRYDFNPLEVMLLFGLTGTAAESITFGVKNIAGVGMWVFVYGLMVYLPAHTVPQERESRDPRWWHWLLAVFLPLVFIFPFVVYVVYVIVRSVAGRVRNATGALSLWKRKETGS
ncbi:MAG TPA: hypothetical protein HPP83_03065 [Candidatus Hydrogenedentes bacterium]|nr:hypothetical protein [Candidatus Hydrogenedentota bacterium]